MKFYIDYNISKQIGFREKEEYVDVWEFRTVTIKEFDKRFGESEGKWENKGTNHKEYNGKCYRQKRIKTRYIEINSMSELCETLSDFNLYIYNDDNPPFEPKNIYFISEIGD